MKAGLKFGPKLGGKRFVWAAKWENNEAAGSGGESSPRFLFNSRIRSGLFDCVRRRDQFLQAVDHLVDCKQEVPAG